MIRLTLLQARMQIVAAAAALAALALLLIVTGPHLSHLYSTTVAGCASRGDCSVAHTSFLAHDATLRSVLDYLLLVIPGLLGVFWAAPMVAHELETGSYRLTWTQSVTRTRWLGAKLLVAGLAALAVLGLLSIMIGWWQQPFDHTLRDQYGSFDTRGIAPLAYALFAVALGVSAALLLRRSLAAMAVTLVGFVAARLVDTYWIRTHLVPTSHISQPLNFGTNAAFDFIPGNVTVDPMNPDIPNVLIISHPIVDHSGHAVNSATLHQAVQQSCPHIQSTLSTTATGHAAYNHCMVELASRFHVAISYLSAANYWRLQWTEAALFLTAGFVLAASALWWLRHRFT